MNNTKASLSYRKFIQFSGLCIIFIGCWVIVGWLIGNRNFVQFFMGSTPMKINAAVSFIIIGMLELIYLKKNKAGIGTITAAMLVGLHGLVVLGEYILGFNTGIDEFFLKEGPGSGVLSTYPDRISPITAICFVLCGIGFSMIKSGNYYHRLIAQISFHAITLISFIAFLGHITANKELNTIWSSDPISIPATVCLLLVSLSASLFNPNLGATGIFTGNQLGHLFARKLVPRIIVIITILTVLRILMHSYRLIEVEFGITLFALSILITFLLVTISTAIELNRIELAKNTVENTLNRISDFLDYTPDPLLITSPDGKILYANKQTETTFGFLKEELVNSNIEMLIPTRHNKEVNFSIRGYLQGPSKNTLRSERILYAVTKDERKIPVEITINPVNLEQGHGPVVSLCIRDISARIESEQVLKIIIEKNSVFIREAPSALAMFDNDMKYIAASQKWIEDYHLEGKEIINKSHYEIFPEIGEDWKQMHRECLAGAVNKCAEASFERSDGSLQWISWDMRPWHEANGQIGGLIMQTEDLTEKKLSEFINHRYSSIIEKTSVLSKIGTWEVNFRTNTIHWGKITKVIHEVPDNYEPVLESAIEFYKEGESRDNIRKAVEEAMVHGTPFDVELQIITAKGKIKWVRSIGIVEKVNNKVEKLFGIFQDLEKQKQHENELKELLSLTTDQNNRLKNFAHIVSHNLHSHSGNIKILLSLLLKKLPQANELESARHLIDSANALSETVANLNEIVTMNNITSDQMKPVLLYETLNNTIALISRLAETEGVTISNEIEHNVYIKGITAYVESFFLNLLTNGIKYKDPDKKSYIKFFTTVNDKSLILHVEDNGIGIDLKKHQNKLFGMYKTFHGNADARGLGLFMSKNQIESMGGRIEVESNPGVGTTFHLYFKYE